MQIILLKPAIVKILIHSIAIFSLKETSERLIIFW